MFDQGIADVRPVVLIFFMWGWVVPLHCLECFIPPVYLLKERALTLFCISLFIPIDVTEKNMVDYSGFFGEVTRDSYIYHASSNHAHIKKNISDLFQISK